jgi:hypothetical protein
VYSSSIDLSNIANVPAGGGQGGYGGGGGGYGGGGELSSSAFVDIRRLIKNMLTNRQRLLRWWGVWWRRATKPGRRWPMAVSAGGVIFSPTLRAFVRFEDKKS